jgi:GNAT superfamily N-acetyltransferase
MKWTIRAFEFADLDGMLKVQNACAPIHKVSRAEFERDAETLAPELQRMIFVAERDGIIVGMAIANRIAGMYHPNKFMLELGVLNSHRSTGIGSDLYKMAESHLSTLGLVSITVQVSEQDESGKKFAKSRGFVQQKRDFVSVLELESFDSSEFPSRPENLDIRSLADHDSPETRQEWFDLFSAVRQDVPRSAPPTPFTFEFFETQVINEPDLVRSATLFAYQNGQMVGFTAGYHDQDTSHLDQWLTGVAKEHRGKRIAFALKVAQATEVKRLAIARIKTDNDSRNAPMLAINDKLGFVRQPAVLSMQKDFWGCQG